MALMAALSPAPAAAMPLRDRVTADSLMFERGLASGRLDSVRVLLREDVRAARASADSSALTALLRLHGISLAMAGRTREAEPPLEEAERLALAREDSLAAMTALRWRTYLAGARADHSLQARLSARLLTLARAARNERFESVALNFSGWLAFQRGEHAVARRTLAEAVSIQRRLGLLEDEAIALTSLAATLRAMGERGAARVAHARQIAIARQRGFAWSEAQALRDLAELEMEAGDPALAQSYYRRALEMHCAIGEGFDCASSILGLADCDLEMGRPADALMLSRRGLGMADRGGFPRLRASFLILIGRAERERGRESAADSAWAAVLAMGDAAGPSALAQAAEAVAESHMRAAAPRAALSVIDTAIQRIGPRLSQRALLDLRIRRLQARLDAKRPETVVEEGERLAHAAMEAGLPPQARRALHSAALAASALGRRAEAVRICSRMAEGFELERVLTADPEWREIIGGEGGTSAVDCAAIVRAASRGLQGDAAAYGFLQRFRTRTLLERMQRSETAGRSVASPADPPAPSLLDVQQHGLRDGELLLEWGTSDTLTLLFAISRDSARVVELPGRLSLADDIDLATSVLGTRPPRSTTAAREVGMALFGLLLRGVEDLLSEHRTLLMAADGPLHSVPFGALVGKDGRSLSESHALVHVPSGAALLRIRQRPASRAAAPRLLAYDCGPAEGGPALAGSTREIAWLARSFRGVQHGSAMDPRRTYPPDSLGCFDALHFAGHTALDDRFPWRSGLVLRAQRALGLPKRAASAPSPGSGVDPTDVAASTPGFLTAEQVASGKLSARLVVLASCETARGRALAGEGMAGLSTAFLAAGGQAVLATLWRVDDAVTEDLMREFYLRLASGEVMAEALRMAQSRVRSRESTSHPYYWAGFVLIGDGSTQLTLRERPGAGALLAGAGASLLALGLLSLVVRRRGSGARRARL